MLKENPNLSLRGDVVPEAISRDGIASPSARNDKEGEAYNDVPGGENLLAIISNAFLDSVTRRLPLVATTKQGLIEEMN